MAVKTKMKTSLMKTRVCPLNLLATKIWVSYFANRRRGKDREGQWKGEKEEEEHRRTGCYTS